MPLRRISHVRVEVTDLEQGKAWYRDTFGLSEEQQVPGEKQITLSVPNSGQLVILHRVDQVAERSTRAIKGPHVDFRIAPDLTRRYWKNSTGENITGDPIRRKFPGMNRADIRFTAMIHSAIEFRSGTGSEASDVALKISLVQMSVIASSMSLQTQFNSPISREGKHLRRRKQNDSTTYPSKSEIVVIKSSTPKW